jgi:hypothetical protein
LNGHQDGANRRIKTTVRVGKEIDVSKFGDYRTGRRIKVTGIYDGYSYSMLQPIEKLDENGSFDYFIIEGTDVNSGGVYQCLIEPMQNMRMLLITSVQYHKKDYPIVEKTCKDFYYINVGNAFSAADGSFVLEPRVARNLLIQIHDPDTIVICSGDRTAKAFDLNKYYYINIFSTDEGVRTTIGHKSHGEINWETPDTYDYSNELGQWLQTEMTMSASSEISDYWIRAYKNDEIIYEWLDLGAFLKGDSWVSGY